jgi:hypothetical protein
MILNAPLVIRPSPNFTATIGAVENSKTCIMPKTGTGLMNSLKRKKKKHDDNDFFFVKQKTLGN